LRTISEHESRDARLREVNGFIKLSNHPIKSPPSLTGGYTVGHPVSPSNGYAAIRNHKTPSQEGGHGNSLYNSTNISEATVLTKEHEYTDFDSRNLVASNRKEIKFSSLGNLGKPSATPSQDLGTLATLNIPDIRQEGLTTLMDPEDHPTVGDELLAIFNQLNGAQDDEL
jgi:hypothetical protein